MNESRHVEELKLETFHVRLDLLLDGEAWSSARVQMTLAKVKDFALAPLGFGLRSKDCSRPSRAWAICKLSAILYC